MSNDPTPPAARAPARRPRRKTELLLQGEPDGRRWIAWISKRTYRIHNGRCELDAPAQQEVLHDDEIPYSEDRKPPRVSPPIAVDEMLPFRRATDVVIQAFAHAYKPDTRTLTASVRFGKHHREIVVHGDRVGEIDRAGRPRFSEPAPIEVVPIRYDYAYGGVDLTALGRNGDLLGQLVQDARRGIDRLADTVYHYPRNPCGYGYLMEIDAESFAGRPIPNLEFPFDPLTPQRLAVGKPYRWIHAPLPAGWDYQSMAWFPRLAYLGLAPTCQSDGKLPAEVERGWAARDVLSIPPLYQDPGGPLRPEYAQVASPGMSVSDLAPDEYFELHHVHPNRQVYSFHLPGEVPRVMLELAPGRALTEAESHLCSVVVRPVPGEVVVVWSARAPVALDLTEEQMTNLRREVRWTSAARSTR
ncbi:DUF2169 domain-containing protein [Sorangium sp. So ce295]|uniref:DUF2169 domain-containing protein n=1 Tax=Sorangium sp. So ce295 TaxID=3133295 RepID=UPI003F61C5D4